MASVQIALMKEILGKTRYGNVIEISWKTTDFSKTIDHISEFADPDETFDKFCVLTLVWLSSKRDLSQWPGDRSVQFEVAVNKIIRHTGFDRLYLLALEMKLRTSIDMLNYGRTLVGIEYR